MIFKKKKLYMISLLYNLFLCRVISSDNKYLNLEMKQKIIKCQVDIIIILKIFFFLKKEEKFFFFVKKEGNILNIFIKTLNIDINSPSQISDFLEQKINQIRNMFPKKELNEEEEKVLCLIQQIVNEFDFENINNQNCHAFIKNIISEEIIKNDIFETANINNIERKLNKNNSHLFSIIFFIKKSQAFKLDGILLQKIKNIFNLKKFTQDFNLHDSLEKNFNIKIQEDSISLDDYLLFFQYITYINITEKKKIILKLSSKEITLKEFNIFSKEIDELYINLKCIHLEEIILCNFENKQQEIEKQILEQKKEISEKWSAIKKMLECLQNLDQEEQKKIVFWFQVEFPLIKNLESKKNLMLIIKNFEKYLKTNKKIDVQNQLESISNLYQKLNIKELNNKIEQNVLLFFQDLEEKQDQIVYQDLPDTWQKQDIEKIAKNTIEIRNFIEEVPKWCIDPILIISVLSRKMKLDKNLLDQILLDQIDSFIGDDKIKQYSAMIIKNLNFRDRFKFFIRENFTKNETETLELLKNLELHRLYFVIFEKTMIQFLKEKINKKENTIYWDLGNNLNHLYQNLLISNNNEEKLGTKIKKIYQDTVEIITIESEEKKKSKKMRRKMIKKYDRIIYISSYISEMNPTTCSQKIKIWKEILYFFCIARGGLAIYSSFEKLYNNWQREKIIFFQIEDFYNKYYVNKLYQDTIKIFFKFNKTKEIKTFQDNIIITAQNIKEVKTQCQKISNYIQNLIYLSSPGTDILLFLSSYLSLNKKFLLLIKEKKEWSFEQLNEFLDMIDSIHIEEKKVSEFSLSDYQLYFSIFHLLTFTEHIEGKLKEKFLIFSNMIDILDIKNLENNAKRIFEEWESDLLEERILDLDSTPDRKKEIPKESIPKESIPKESIPKERILEKNNKLDKSIYNKIILIGTMFLFLCLIIVYKYFYPQKNTDDSNDDDKNKIINDYELM
jgi:hypothetical protein